jgi:Fic family protein
MPLATRAYERVPSPAAALSQRIRAEYAEMPCLRLTLPQASRFWNVDRATCLAALDQLVAEGFLVLGRYGYMRI